MKEAKSWRDLIINKYNNEIKEKSATSTSTSGMFIFIISSFFQFQFTVFLKLVQIKILFNYSSYVSSNKKLTSFLKTH